MIRQLRLLSVRQIYQQAASQQSQRKGTTFSFRSLLPSFIQWPRSKAQLPRHGPANRKGDGVSGRPCCIQASTNTHKHHFIHWCIPWSRYATRMSALQSCHFKTDIDLFGALNQGYARSKGRYKKLLSFKKPTALRFVKASSSYTPQGTT